MWEIYTYGGGDYLRLVFNGIASIFGNDDYGMAITIAALMGFVSVMIMGAFRRGELNIQWLIAIIMIYYTALVPKTDIIINDQIVPANNAVVANIPMGISAVASIFSHFSNWFTGVTETVFSMPNDIRYTTSGLLFANTLVEEASRFEITTPQVATNFTEFWKSCVYYDLLLGLYTWGDVVQSPDLMGFFQGNTSVTRSFTYLDVAGDRSILTCRDGIGLQMDIDYQLEILNATNIHGARLAQHEVDNNQAVAKYSAAMPVAFQYLTNMAQTNAQIVGQNSVANSLKRGLINFASEADAPAAAQDFALARAEQERRTTFMTMGQIAKRMLPILQHLFESFIYAIFPLVMLMAMTPLVGKVSLGYVKAVLWVNLWPPLYAILHFAISYYSAKAGAAAVITDGAAFTTGLSLMTNTGLGKVMEDYAAIAGYLSLSIPMIAWLIVSMSGAMMAGLAGRLMQGYESPVSKASDESISGVGMGNTQFMNTSAFQNNSSPTVDSGMIHERLGSGTMMDTSAAGRYMQQNVSQGGTSVDLGQSIVDSSQQRLDSANQRVSTESTELAQSSMATLRESNQINERVSASQGTQTSTSQAESTANTKAHTEIDKALDKWGKSENIAVTDELRGSVYGAIEGSAGVSLFGNGATVKGGVSAQGTTSESEGTTSQQVQDFTSSNEFSEAVTSIAMASRTMAADYGVKLDNSTQEALDASMTEQQTNKRERAEAISDVETATVTLSRAESFSSSFKQNGLDKLYDYATENGKMTATEIDQLFIHANQGGSRGMEAMETLRTIAMEGVMAGGLDPNFERDNEAMMASGKNDINTMYASNGTQVSGADEAWRAQVSSGDGGEITVPLSSADVKETVSRTATVNRENMDNPENVRTQNGTVDTINRGGETVREEGQQTIDGVDTMRVLNDTPGAAGVYGDAQRDSEVDELKNKIRERNSTE
jgi:conjugal transfer mating pair stabilization protein TraG